MLGGGGEQGVGHDGERPRVGTGMGAQGVLEPARHEGGVAGLSEEVVEELGEVGGL